MRYPERPARTFSATTDEVIMRGCKQLARKQRCQISVLKKRDYSQRRMAVSLGVGEWVGYFGPVFTKLYESAINTLIQILLNSHFWVVSPTNTLR